MDTQSPDQTQDQLSEPATRPASCPTHGGYESNQFGIDRWKMWSRCPKCEAAAEARRQADEREAAEQQTAESLNKRLAESGLSPRFRTASFESFIADSPEKLAARTACRGFVEGMRSKASGGLWLVGPPGTGKTHLGAAMVNQVIREVRAYAAIHSAREIVRMLRAGWGDRSSRQHEDDVLESLGWMSLLVIDEVGVGFGSESELVQLFDVIDLRYRNELPTALISNLSAKELKPVLGDAAYDRLREGAVLVPCNWKSHRQGRA